MQFVIIFKGTVIDHLEFATQAQCESHVAKIYSAPCVCVSEYAGQAAFDAAKAQSLVQ